MTDSAGKEVSNADDSSAARQAFTRDRSLAPALLHLLLGNCPCAALQQLVGRQDGKELHDASDNARPASLVTHAESRSVVAVEVFVELKVVAPVRIRLKLLGAAIERASTIRIAQPTRYSCAPARNTNGCCK